MNESKSYSQLLTAGIVTLIIGTIIGAIWFCGYLYGEILTIGKALGL